MKSNSKKTLNEEIERIKSLFYENFNKNEFIVSGNTETSWGYNVKLMNNDECLGETNLMNYEDAWDLDYAIVRFNNEKDKTCKFACDSNYFNGDNALYLYSLNVDPRHRGNGYSKQIMNRCHEIAKEKGYEYVLLITDCNNEAAQNLYKGLGYSLHQTDGNKDFYFLKV
jgi:ribosomal protein S18 acetylase RimI-like enzyme